MKMRNVSTVILVFLVYSLAILPLLSIVRVSYAAPPRIYLDPLTNTFYTNVTRIGDRFNVTVWLQDAFNVAGVQIFIEFSESMVNVTRWFEPKSDPQYIFKTRTTSALPTPPSDVNYNRTGAGKASIKLAVSLFPPPPNQPSFNGTGKVCIIEFKVTALPSPGGILTSTLHIDFPDTFLLDASGVEVPSVIKENGFLNFIYVYPPSRIRLDSPTYIYNTTSVGHLFNVTIWLENATNVAGVQIYLEFDDRIINITRWFEPNNDTQYIFYGKETSALPPPSIPNYRNLETGKASVMASVNLFPTPPQQPTFNGTGKVCIFEFNMTNSNAPVGSILSLHSSGATGGTYLLDGNGVEIPNVTLVDSSYEYIPEFTPLFALTVLMALSALVSLFGRRRSKELLRRI
jgi:hypothetical protein